MPVPPACTQHFRTDFLLQLSILLPGTLGKGCATLSKGMPFLSPTSKVFNISPHQDGGGPMEMKVAGLHPAGVGTTLREPLFYTEPAWTLQPELAGWAKRRKACKWGDR